MKKSIIIISSLLVITLVSGSAFAWGSGKRSGKGQGMGYNQQNAINNLSQEQKDELSAIRQKFIDETYELRTAKMQKQQEIRMLMETSNPDRGKLDKLSEKITDYQKQIRDKQIDFQLAAKKIAPELVRGQGLRQRCGRQSGMNGQNNCQGQGGFGCGRYIN